MTVSTRWGVLLLAACFVGGCMTGCCPTPSKSDGGPHGTSGGGTTGGSSCESAGTSCATLDNCCGGTTCNSGTCVPIGNTQDAGPDAGCTLQPAGGSCVSLADCKSPNVCLPGSDGGVCGPVTVTSSLTCSATGQSCSATLPCCGGECRGGSCVPYAVCGTQAASCASNSDCCNGFTCATPPGASGGPVDGGTAADAGAAGTGKICVPVCGGESAPCTTDSDCCNQQGMFCLGTGVGSQMACFPQSPNQVVDSANAAVPCGGPCSSFECQLGAACTPPANQASPDPCAQAGLVCDLQTTVCRAPNETEGCIPGGPACQPIPNSTVADLQCAVFPAQTGPVNLCLQPCQATSDCVDPDKSCTPGKTKFCWFNQGCKSYFQSCASSSAGDGLCVPINNGGLFGLCFQTNLDGGAAGTPCLAGGGNRQVGQGCDINDYCGLNSFCQPICNAGTGSTPGCPGGADGGLGCIADQGETGNAQDFGTCATTCDFTASNGGGCVAPNGTSPEKCFPEFFLSLPDSTKGVCFPALPAAQQLAVGATCNPASPVDECVPGALCLTNGSCDKICDAVGQSGPSAGCTGTQTCHGFQLSNSGKALAQYTGYCQ